MKKSHIKWDYDAYLFIAPNYLIYFVFILIPLISVVVLSFTRYTLISSPSFIGIKNYINLLNDSDFLVALKNTTIYWICTVPSSMALGLLFAIVLNQPLMGKGVFRAAYYLPNVLSLVAVAITWVWIYDPTRGILNSLFISVHLTPSDWILDPDIALACVIAPSIWTLLGFNMVIFLAGLQTIPSQLYEAATVDGASSLRKFISITIPMLRPITFFLFVMSSIKSFQVFDQIYIMTKGGPAKSTTTIAYEIYEKGFQFFKMGYASAMAVYLLAIVTIITLFNYAYGETGYVAEIR